MGKMKQVTLDPFSIALALPSNDGGGRPSQEHLEEFRLAVIHHLLGRTKPKYPTLATLEMNFKNFAYGSKQPEPKFQVYWEVDSVAHFNMTTKKKNLPKSGDLFKAIGSAFDQQLFGYLRSVLTDSPLATAVEVTVRQVKEATAGGAVKAPPFYMAFVSERKPGTKLTEKQINKLVEYSYPLMVEQLKNTYPKDFEDMTLQIVKTEINEDAGKPVDTFNIYVEFEAVGTFLKNAPPPMQFFADLSSFNILVFLIGIGDCLGGYFHDVGRMAINPCAWVENEVEDMDDPAEDADIVPVHVEFWVALVVPQQKQCPGKEDIFDQMIKNDFVLPILTKAYGTKKVELDIKKKGSCEFDVGVPVPRFNVLHRYEVDIQMTNPIPLPTQILSKIIRGGNLLGNIIKLPAPWNRTTEVTLGVAGNETMGKEETYSSKIQSPDKRRRLPSDPEKTKKIVPESLRQTSTPPKRQVKKNIEKKRKASKKTEPEIAPTEPSFLGADVFLALTITEGDCADDIIPKEKDYEKLQEATFGFYTDYLREIHGSNLLDFDVSLEQSLVNASKPDDSYNIYVEWRLSATFADALKAPSRITFCQQLVNDINTMDYLKNRVRSLKATPFEHAFRMYTEQVLSD